MLILRIYCFYCEVVRALVQEFGQHGSITDVAARDFDGPHLERFLVDAYVYFAPDTAFGTAILARIPLAFTFGFDPRAIDEEVQGSLGSTIRQAYVQCFLTPT